MVLKNLPMGIKFARPIKHWYLVSTPSKKIVFPSYYLGWYHIDTREVHVDIKALAQYIDMNGTETIHTVKFPYQTRLQKNEILIIHMQMVKKKRSHQTNAGYKPP